MPGKDFEKAQKAKVDAFNNPGLKRDQATKVHEDPDRMNSERIPQSYISKLQTTCNLLYNDIFMTSYTLFVVYHLTTSLIVTVYHVVSPIYHIYLIEISTER